MSGSVPGTARTPASVPLQQTGCRTQPWLTADPDACFRPDAPVRNVLPGPQRVITCAMTGTAAGSDGVGSPQITSAILNPASAHSMDNAAAGVRAAISHAAHLLPSQGPIEVFVHHNTLHAFEHLPFEDAVVTARQIFGASPYLTEQRYRQELTSGRILWQDLREILRDEPGQYPDLLIASLGTRYELRLALMQTPLIAGSAAELDWMLEEEDSLRTFLPHIAETRREQMRRDFLRQLEHVEKASTTASTADLPQIPLPVPDVVDPLLLQSLWSVSRQAALHFCGEDLQHVPDGILTNPAELAQQVNDLLIPFCAAYLDQGISNWSMPDRKQGFFAVFLNLQAAGHGPMAAGSGLRREVRRLQAAGSTAMQSVLESLQLLGLEGETAAERLQQELLELPGWAGMLSEVRRRSTAQPAITPDQELEEYLAVRLLLKRTLPESVLPLSCSAPDSADDQQRQMAFTIFQVAQIRGWNPLDLQRLSVPQWQLLFREILGFDELERRRVFHLAYEKKYRDEVLTALVHHTRRRHEVGAATVAATRSGDAVQRPPFQFYCCIDDREESLRRHIEEIEPRARTFGMAGFYGIAMRYRGIADAGFRQLCPVNLQPQHFVEEQPLYSQIRISRWQAAARRGLGQATRQARMGSRTVLGGLLAGLLGSLAAIPLVARILFPWLSARIRDLAGRIVIPSATELRIERIGEVPSASVDGLGFSVQEMADIVMSGMRSTGLTPVRGISRLVFLCGHGSGSVNNPHESAYNCGACSGGQGGPNARAFSQMANDHRVRGLMQEQGLSIPEDTWFIGGYHDTCNDSITWYDLDRLPIALRAEFEQAQLVIDEARGRSAQERCRRFDTAAPRISPRDALLHVEGRAEDLSQVRPEYNHATTALCLVGSRDWSRGLFLDRRAFLTSYAAQEDTPDGAILAKILQAVIPVCAGISLEYYFSAVDNEYYGCGNKLPHNLTSLLGVMAGAASDLRPGLAAQMVEIHEPMRLLFIVESAPDALLRILNSTPQTAALLNGSWIQVAAFDPQSATVHLWDRDHFAVWNPAENSLRKVRSSADWFVGNREHLAPATVCIGEAV